MLGLQTDSTAVSTLAWVLVPLLGVAAVGAVALYIVLLALRAKRARAESAAGDGSPAPSDPDAYLRRVFLALSGIGLVLCLASDDLRILTAGLFVVFGALYLEMALLALLRRG